jgi:hypothetical protein
MWLFCFVVAYVIVRAWEQARAQAGAEARRAREHIAGEFAARMAAGEASNPLENWWWWPAAGRRAWRAMRGARQGSRNTALPGRSPWRRVAQAARAGAARGAAEGTRRASERRQGRRAARTAAGGGRTSRATRRAAASAASGAGFAAGWAAGRAGWRRWRPVRFVRVGVCDNCGTVCALPAMSYQRVDVGGRTETWLLCADCRTGDAQGPAPAPSAVTAVVQAAAIAGHASDGPLAFHADNGGITGADRVPVPAGDPGQPGRWPAPAGQPPEAAAPARAAAITDVPHGELAAGAVSTETSTDGNGGLMTTGRVGNELELAGGGSRLPARAGESYNYGAWQRATASDAELLDQLGLALEAMLSDLTAVSAGRSQVQNVSAWADRVRAEADLTREAIDEMDRRYKPVIGAVAAIGGPDEASDTSYYEEY